MKIITNKAEALAALSPKRSKYGVKTESKDARTIDGVCFDSMKEANRYCQLLECEPLWS